MLAAITTFGASPWLRTYLRQLIDTYFATVNLDSKQFVSQLKRAADEVRTGGEWRGAGAFFLLMTPEQRELFYRVQAVMSLVEGHASFVMNELIKDRVSDADALRRSLDERRKTSGIERSFQKAIGFESKVKQYDAGEYFVRTIVDAAGMETFNLIWSGERNLPNLAEIADPGLWLARVAGS